jgi:hypothetical protein
MTQRLLANPQSFQPCDGRNNKHVFGTRWLAHKWWPNKVEYLLTMLRWKLPHRRFVNECEP